jgi:hypothetical protein
VRKAMRERGQPFKQVLNAAIREGLSRRKPARPFKQRTFDMGRPLFDLTKALSLAAELEDAETVDRMRGEMEHGAALLKSQGLSHDHP